MNKRRDINKEQHVTRPNAFVVGPYGFFRPRLRKCARPLNGTFISGFAKKRLAGPYGSYDNINYATECGDSSVDSCGACGERIDASLGGNCQYMFTEFDCL